MPIYEYKCDNGHVFDALQKMSEEPLGECTECGAPAHRVLTPVAIHFKGSGFHNTDYGKSGGGGESSESGGDSGGDSGGSGEGSSDSSSSSSSSNGDSGTSKSADSGGSGGGGEKSKKSAAAD